MNDNYEHDLRNNLAAVIDELDRRGIANGLTGALLMYHGLHDQNVGTDPIHSPKLFHALDGLDKEVAMYLYPFEDHGPAARETLLDLWARWTAWLDKHLLTNTGRNAISDDESGEGGAGR